MAARAGHTRSRRQQERAVDSRGSRRTARRRCAVTTSSVAERDV